MHRGSKIGIILILIGIGIPLVLCFFQDDGVIYEIQTSKVIERKLNPAEIESIKAKIKKLNETTTEIESYFDRLTKQSRIDESYEKDRFDKERWTVGTRKTIEIPFRQVIGIGLIFILFGIGLFIFSLVPKDKPKK